MSFIGKISAALTSIAFALLTACSSGSSDPTTIAADFSAHGVNGTVSGQNITLDLSGLGNCATTVENMVIGINANGASISPDPRVARDYSQPVQFTLTAPDGTKAVYTVTVKGAACVIAPPPPPPSTSDTTPPVITVLGTNPLSLTVGTAYTEAGATCVDDKDPSCTVVTTGTVNTAAVGTYVITYTATDAAGNVSSKTRVVSVEVVPNTQFVMGNIVCTATAVTLGETVTCHISPVDPDGIASVSATLDGTPVTLNSSYSVSLSSLSVGNHALVFNGIGKKPDGSNEMPVTATQSLIVNFCPPGYILIGNPAVCTIND